LMSNIFYFIAIKHLLDSVTGCMKYDL